MDAIFIAGGLIPYPLKCVLHVLSSGLFQPSISTPLQYCFLPPTGVGERMMTHLYKVYLRRSLYSYGSGCKRLIAVNVSSIMLEMLGRMNSERGVMVRLAWSGRSLLRLRRSVGADFTSRIEKIL